MTEEEAIRKLEKGYDRYAGDDEALHSFGDSLMLEIISDLGWSEFLSRYEEAEHYRWCA